MNATMYSQSVGRSVAVSCNAKHPTCRKHHAMHSDHDLHRGLLHVTHVKQTTFFVTHIAASLIMELHQPATSINLSCHITSTPRLVLLQPSNLSRIFTTTHTLLKQSSIRNNPMTQLHTSDSQASLTTSLFLSLC